MEFGLFSAKKNHMESYFCTTSTLKGLTVNTVLSALAVFLHTSGQLNINYDVETISENTTKMKAFILKDFKATAK